ncbi:VOC family protein [Solirubrobacter phytolaccae]|uniref:VOC family protein n=1 Tax=Solirubrobacter phytolaccae TaxID=1404360 RepID=A0A9X3N4I1_9ACTN|nr:VOC family protein [Solirubrobacter phytolaccae]MDA0179563.1 VOC family protein [Solirubrobacter phytolaccae]
MTATQINPASALPTTGEFRLEVIAIPVSDVDRAKQFYGSLGWREDVDFKIRPDFRVVHMTPPGSPASVLFGKGVTNAEPGSVSALTLAVDDVDAARAELVSRGIDVSEVFHGASGFDLAGQDAREPGRDPENQSYSSWASFSDPDGNGWLLQEIKTRLPGR